MGSQYNDASEKDSAPKKDLDLEDVGVSFGEKTIDLDPRSLPMITIAIVTLGILFSLITSITQTITAFVVALLFSFALDPLIVKIQYLSFKRLPITQKVDQDGEPIQRIGRYSAVSIVLATFLVLISVGGYLIAPRVVDEVSSIPQQIPETVESLATLPIIGERLGTEKVQVAITEALEELPDRLSSRNSPLGDIFRSLVDGAYLGFLFIIMFISILLDGPRIVRNIRRLISPAKREAADRIGRATHRVLGKYMAGSIFIAVLAGFVIGTLGLILGVPLAPLIGLWIMFTNLIPQIGGFLGAVPFVVFGFTESLLTGILCLVLFWVYQTIENNVLQPIVIGKTVSLSPPVTMVAALIGVSTGGVIGALLAVPLAGATKALAAEFDFPKGSRAKTLEYDKIDESRIKKAHIPKNSSKK